VKVLRFSELGEGVDGYRPILVVVIEIGDQRLLIGKLGFPKGYALLDFGKIVQEHVAIHAAVYDDVHFVAVKVRFVDAGETSI
jgi:hypothetical protein